MEVLIDKKVIKELVNYGLQSPLKEVCGLLLGKKTDDWEITKFVPINNITGDDELIDYQMNPQQVMNELQKTTKFKKDALYDFVGIYHTHPKGISKPSSIDIDRVAYPIPYLIFGLGELKIRAFKIDKKNRSYETLNMVVVNE